MEVAVAFSVGRCAAWEMRTSVEFQHVRSSNKVA